MKPASQIAILKTIVHWQADEIEALQDLVRAATELTNIREEQLRDELFGTLTGSIDGLDGELRVRFLTPQEHAWAKLQRAGKATRTVEPEWGDGRA